MQICGYETFAQGVVTGSEQSLRDWPRVTQRKSKDRVASTPIPSSAGGFLNRMGWPCKEKGGVFCTGHSSTDFGETRSIRVAGGEERAPLGTSGKGCGLLRKRSPGSAGVFRAPCRCSILQARCAPVIFQRRLKRRKKNVPSYKRKKQRPRDPEIE